MSRRGSERDRPRTSLPVVAFFLMAGAGWIAGDGPLAAGRPGDTPFPPPATGAPSVAPGTPSAAPGEQPRFPLVAIINYHDISADPRSRLEVVSPEFLRAQIRSCKAAGWTFLPLSELLAAK